MFDFLKALQGMKLGDPTMFAPKGDGGWQTAIQKAGSPMTETASGAFAGFNPSVGDIGNALKDVGKGMSQGGGMGAFAQSNMSGGMQQDDAQPMIQAPKPIASATPQMRAPQGGSWIQNLMR